MTQITGLHWNTSLHFVMKSRTKPTQPEILHCLKPVEMMALAPRTKFQHFLLPISIKYFFFLKEIIPLGKLACGRFIFEFHFLSCA